MDRLDLIKYIKYSKIFTSWHWFNYHFSCVDFDGIEHPFARSIIDACLIIEQKIPNYAFKIIDRMASLHGKEKDLGHYEQLMQILAELLVVSHLALEFPREKFLDEPTIGSSKKNPELIIEIDSYMIGVEVKAPSLLEHQKRRSTQEIQLPSRSRIRQIVLDSLRETEDIILPRDNPIKDFLISSNEKFKEFKKNIKNFYGILIIVWDDYIYEPISSLVNKESGLLTKNSFAKENGEPLKFPNIDAVIIIRHLHQFQLSAGDQELIYGKVDMMDYGQKGEFPFKVIIPVPGGQILPNKIIEAFQAIDFREASGFGAEYRPQEYIMWFKL